MDPNQANTQVTQVNPAVNPAGVLNAQNQQVQPQQVMPQQAPQVAQPVQQVAQPQPVTPQSVQVQNAAPAPQPVQSAIQPQVVQQPVAQPVQPQQVQSEVMASSYQPQTNTITATTVASQISNVTNVNIPPNQPEVQAPVQPQQAAQPQNMQAQGVNNPYVNPMMMQGGMVAPGMQAPMMYPYTLPVAPVMYQVVAPVQPVMQQQTNQPHRLIGQDVYQVDNDTQSIQSYNDMVLKKFYGEEEKQKTKAKERNQKDDDNMITLGKILTFILSIVNLIFAPSFVLKSLMNVDMFKTNTKLLLYVFLGYIAISILLIISSGWKLAKCNKIMKIIYFILLIGFLALIAIFGMGYYVLIQHTIELADTAKMNTFTTNIKMLMTNAEQEWITDGALGGAKYVAYAQGITCTKVDGNTNTETETNTNIETNTETQTEENVTVEVDKDKLLVEQTVVETNEAQSVDSNIVPTVNNLEGDRFASLTYFVGLNKEGKIVDLYATDGTYVIAAHSDTEIDKANIKAIHEEATVKSPDGNVRLISSFEGKTSVSFTCTYDDNEYKVSAILK